MRDATGDATGSDPAAGARPARRRDGPLARVRRRVHLPPLTPRTRLLLLVLGWVLLVVGVAGLVLPGIQGLLTILLAAALLSLVSRRAHELLRRGFRGWPRGWRRLLRLRRDVHQRVSGGGGPGR